MKKESNKAISEQKRLLDNKKSSYQKYKEINIGNQSFLYFLKYELIMFLFSGLNGAIGYFFRKIFFKKLFRKVGRGVIFGKNMTIRHPKKIEIGNNVIFDDNTVIDAKGETNNGITLKNNVFIGRNSILSCKGGDIYIDEYSNIGANNYLISESTLKIGKFVFTAGNTYVVAGGNHSFDRKDIPIWKQPSLSRGGINIEDDVWIGASVTILDGVEIKKGSIIAAGAIVNKSIDEYTIAGGIPAKKIKSR